MQRLRLACFLLALVPAVTFAADDKKPNLYPMTKGTKWEYELKVPGQTLPLTTEITDVAKPEKKNDPALVTLTTVVNDMKIPETLSEDAKGVYRHSTGDEKFSTPVLIVKYPAKGGTKWDQTLTVAKMEVKANFEMKDAEDVTVPAGKYKAFPVVYTASAQGQEIEATSWYADGVGLVKMQIKTGGVTSTMELKKFTAGKKDK